jgi:CRISPR-associated protein Cas1
MINEVLYCERLMYIEWVQGDFADNAFTVEGRLVHRRADVPSGKLPPSGKGEGVSGPEQGDDDESPDPGPPPYTARSVWLSAESIGITAKIDVVEGSAEGTVVPIEYKRGKAPDVADGAYLPERAQLCAQVMVLREHGYRCDEAAIYFAGSRRRVSIVIDEALVSKVHRAVDRARELASRPEPPAPLQDDARCNGCSLVGICLPDETNLLRRMAGASLDSGPVAQSDPLDVSEGDPWGLVGVPDEGIRRLHAARDESVPLYVQEQGARVGLDAHELIIRSRNGATTARLAHTSQVCLYGNIQISTQAMRALLDRGIPLSLFSYGGWFLGRMCGPEPKNVDLRIAQYRAATDAGACLRIARGLVVGKIKNSRTMLRRNHGSPDPVALFELEQLARKASEAERLDELLGLEGTAARTYFGEFTGMLKGEAARVGAFDLDGRNRRPPRDPINALLSYSYSLLTKDFTVTLGAVGLDPMLGFYHQPRFGRPALALDLMEEFRPLVADSMVIGVLNNGVIDPSDFVTNGAAVSLVPAARRKVLLAYERRMDQLVTHPVFGYRISYRRVLEVQARLLGRVMLGEIETYPSFRTR